MNIARLANLFRLGLIPRPLKAPSSFESDMSDTRDIEFRIDEIYDIRHRVTEFVIRNTVERDELFCEHGLAVPPEHLRFGYGGDASGYLDGGRSDAASLFQLLEKNGRAFRNPGSILDFGCGVGRVTRWVKDFTSSAEIWGVDIDAIRISWAKNVLASRAHFAMTTKIPHLPFEDRTFDLAFAFSVFSHIDDLADAWLLELNRVVKPGGSAIITIMDNSTIDLMQNVYNDHALPQRLTGYAPFYENRDFSMFSISRDSNPDVWYDTDYFLDSARRSFEIVDVVPGFHGWQTGVLLIKPTA